MDTETLQAIKENTAALNQLIGLITAKETRSDWVPPEEAARIMGLSVTKGGEHRKRLRWCIREGVLKQFRPGRPPLYYRQELEKVAKKIASGEIGFIGRA